MKYLTLLLAWRSIGSARATNHINTSISTVFISIAISSLGLALTIAIMQGFEQETTQRLQSIHPPIMIGNGNQPLAFEAITHILNQEFPEVIAISPESEYQIILQDPISNDISSVLTLKAIDPTTASLVTALEQKLIAHDKPISLGSMLEHNHLIIGTKLAEIFNLRVGDTVQILYTPHLFDKHISARKRTKLVAHIATIGGLFQTGIQEFDMGLVISSLDLFQQLLPQQGITMLNLRLHHHAHEQATIQALRQRLQLEVFTWKDLYAPLVAALKLEKYGMTSLLLLMLLIACMNIVSLLILLIRYKQTDIALLHIMGMAIADIRAIFMTIALTVAGLAALVGVTLAGLIAWILQRYPCIQLPDAYMVTHLPVAYTVTIALGVWIVVVCMSFIAALLPLQRLQGHELLTLLHTMA